ncbi:conjugal transfer protein TraI [Olivibacter domesticus]|uniref:Conjugal transfer protein TraI n=1 Tax=Olivibacter domesticus TaxID=407022 RepID=A0A1H7IBR2_OLID1|nr:conjugal transfer protein TraI [Olivibacter domesticus]SEK58960.1 hypothetical protein SAMN05661044_00623 [Olivibacter domesticus]
MKCWVRKVVVVMMCSFLLLPSQEVSAFPILEIIKAAVVKVIKAVDLAIQRQQNKIIWLQNAEKALENAMAKLKLEEISKWSERQREQYAKYFEELQKVKLMITFYSRIKDITSNQAQIVLEFQNTWKVLQGDRHFNRSEIEYMGTVYSGILNETIQHIDELSLVVNSFQTQMSDAKRLEMINAVGDRVEENLRDIRIFNRENAMLSIQRARSQGDISLMKALYGIE